jgi:hypothetical protein
MSGSIGGYFPGLAGSSGAVLQLWVEVVPGATYSLVVGAGGAGQTTTSSATSGQATTFSGAGGANYSAGGGQLSLGFPTTTPPAVWGIPQGFYLYGLGGSGGDPVASNPSGGPGGSGLIVIEWVD